MCCKHYYAFKHTCRNQWKYPDLPPGQWQSLHPKNQQGFVKATNMQTGLVDFIVLNPTGWTDPHRMEIESCSQTCFVVLRQK